MRGHKMLVSLLVFMTLFWGSVCWLTGLGSWLIEVSHVVFNY